MYGDEGGFYLSGGEAGRSGDFLTSPELSPLFGAVVARVLDRWWEELDAPDPFIVIEAGAGAAKLARDVLAADPMCAPALRYVLVERSPRLRERHAVVVPIEPSALALGPMEASDDDSDGAHALPGRGPRFASLEDLPVGEFTGVVLANELLDNLAFSVLERTRSGWAEVRVGESDAGGTLVEVITIAGAADEQLATRLAPSAAVGARIPLQRAATSWLRDALRTLDRGRVAVIDYASTSDDLARRPIDEWVRTYRGGGRGGPTLDRPGSQDITCEVCTDQLARVQALSADRSQAEFLDDHGLTKIVDAARAKWEAGASKGDLDSLKAKSIIHEAAALTDPSGLGAFRVLEWNVG